MSKRLLSVDALRGVALILMVIDHCFDWWLAEDYRGEFADGFTEFLGTMAAPIFLLLVGVGQALSIHRKLEKGSDKSDIWRYSVRRGLLIIAIGYALNFIVFFTGSNWKDVFAVDVLHLIGLGIIVSVPVVIYLPSLAVAIVGIAWFILGAVLGGDFEAPAVIGGWINGETGIGYFPILPWLGYIFIGVIVGRWLLGRIRQDPVRLNPYLWIIAVVAFLLLFVAPPEGYRHPRLNFIVFSLMMMFATWSLLQALVPFSVVRRFLIQPLALMGQVALMLYAFHHLIAHRLLYHVGWVRGRSWYEQYGEFSPTQALVGLVVVLALCYLVSKPWLRNRDTIQANTLGHLPFFYDLRTQKIPTPPIAEPAK